MAACVPKRREGGAAGIIYNLAQELEKRGHEIVTLFQEDVLDSPVFPRRLEELYFATKVAFFISRAPQRFSVVNIHAPNGFVYGHLRRLPRFQPNPPYVMTIQGVEERYGHAMRREAKKGRAWHFAARNRLWWRAYHLARYRWSIRTADAAICANREAWSYLQARYNLDSERVWWVPNGVEDRFFVSRQYSTPASPRLLYVGSWLDRKGIYYLRDAMTALADKSPGLKLTVAGCFADSATVKSFFAPPARPQVDVIPFVPSEELPGLYLQHDIFVFPSLMEGMPLALLEAMATGMPVVTTETCGMVDVVEHEVNGLLVPPANAEALIEAILRLSESAELRKRLGQAAQETMRRYTWDQIARKVERVFELAVQDGNRRGDKSR